MNILIVEDEKHIAEGLRFNLEADGFDVKTAHDGEAALEILKENDFDAIVLDVMMPKMDGFTVARTLRDAENFTPILMLTALGKPEDVLQGFEAGADDYLPKPFDLNDFSSPASTLFCAAANGFRKQRKLQGKRKLFRQQPPDRFRQSRTQKRNGNDSDDLDGSQTFALSH